MSRAAPLSQGPRRAALPRPRPAAAPRWEGRSRQRRRADPSQRGESLLRPGPFSGLGTPGSHRHKARRAPPRGRGASSQLPPCTLWASTDSHPDARGAAILRALAAAPSPLRGPSQSCPCPAAHSELWPRPESCPARPTPCGAGFLGRPRALSGHLEGCWSEPSFFRGTVHSFPFRKDTGPAEPPPPDLGAAREGAHNPQQPSERSAPVSSSEN